MHDQDRVTAEGRGRETMETPEIQEVEKIQNRLKDKEGEIQRVMIETETGTRKKVDGMNMMMIAPTVWSPRGKNSVQKYECI